MSKALALWPAMFYHPKTAAYVICDTEAEVPKGYVDDPKKVKSYNELSTAELPRDDVFIVRANSTNVTLETLELTRKEALALLKEAKVKVPAKSTDDVVAQLVQDNFEDEDADEDNADEDEIEDDGEDNADDDSK